MLPKVYFEFGSLHWDTEFITARLSGRWKEKILKVYPELSDLHKSKNQKKDIKNFIIRMYREKFDKIADSVVRFQEVWNEKNEGIMNALLEVLEVESPEDMTIIASIGVNPIFPRDWKTWAFSLYYNINDEKMIHASAHEITHFFYFKKLIDEFPKINTKTFDGPHKEWKLSEIIAPIILNDARIAKVIGKSGMGTYVCDNTILLKFNELYNKHLENKTSFINFYEKARKLIEKIDI